MIDFERAKDKVLLGAERRSMVMTEEDKRITAYHEAGHALVGLHVPGNDPLHKVTIIPRGRALGVTMNLPETDRYSLKFREITAKLAMMFGGRLAEEIIYGPENVSTGASNDIQQATNLARRMVTEWGMSEKLGRLRYVDNQEEVFLGHSVTRSQTISGATAKLIDEEIRRLIEEAELKARTILTEHLDDLHTVAKALLEYETLSGDEVKALLRGEPIRVGGEDSSGPVPPRSSVPSSGAPARGDSGRPRPGFEPEPQPGA
jgi:cell division protease FtsH